MISLATVSLPEFGWLPSVRRFQNTCCVAASKRRSRMETAGLDVLVVYADREHSANLAYLTGFDPALKKPSCCWAARAIACWWSETSA